MNNGLKVTCLIGSALCLFFILAEHNKIYNHNHINKPVEVSLLDYKDRKNLDKSIRQLFEGKTNKVVCGIIGNNRSSYKDYDNEIKKYCSNYGVKTTNFIHADNGNINAVTLKR